MPVKALGKGSVASALNSVLLIARALAWVGFVACAVIIVGFLLIDLFGIKIPALEVSGDMPMAGYGIALAILVVTFIGFILITSELRKILQTLVDGDPFVPDNAKRLLQLCYIIAGMEIFSYLIGLAANVFEMESSKPLTVNFAAWGAVIILWVLSHVFAEGARLRDEEKMTI